MKLLSKAALIGKLLTSKTYRDAYVYERVRNGVPFQIRAMREERGWTQGKLGELSGKPRNVISRLEDPNYGKLTIKTLLEIASAFDVALLVKFVPFSRLLREYDDTSSPALAAESIYKETSQLGKWARLKDRSYDNVTETEPTNCQLPLQLGEYPESADATSNPSSHKGKLVLFATYRTLKPPFSTRVPSSGIRSDIQLAEG